MAKQTINTSKFLVGIQSATSTPFTTAANSKVQEKVKPGGPISSEEISKAKTRIKLIRYLDDGLQTLGKMQVIGENGNVAYELTSVELAWNDNISGVSCIPPGKYLVRSRVNENYGKHFWVFSNEASGWKENTITGNGNIRNYVLIHKSNKSNYLMGCIGPGESYSSNLKGNNEKDRYVSKGATPGYSQGALKGNPWGINGTYKNAQKYINRLVSTLWKEGDSSLSSFFMEISNNSPLLTGADQAAKLLDKNNKPIIFI